VAADKRSSVRRKPLAFWLRVGAPVAIAASFVFAISIMLDSGVRYDSAPSVHQELSVEADKTSPVEDTPIEREQRVAIAQDAFNESRAKVATRRDIQPDIQPDIQRDIQLEKQQRQPSSPTPMVQARSIAEPVSAPIVSEAKANEPKKESTASNASVGTLSASVAAERPVAESRATTHMDNQLDKVIVTGQSIRGTAEDTALPVDVISAEDLSRVRAEPNAGPRSTMPADSFAKKKVSDAELAKQREAEPEEWLAYIRELRATGKSRDADAEWKRFVKAYPTYSVAAADTARPKK
jgi:hypothetical protein